MMEAEICAALCAPQIPIKYYSAVIGELAHFLPSRTSSSGFAALVPPVVLFGEAAEGCKDLIPPPPYFIRRTWKSGSACGLGGAAAAVTDRIRVF